MPSSFCNLWVAGQYLGGLERIYGLHDQHDHGRTPPCGSCCSFRISVSLTHYTLSKKGDGGANTGILSPPPPPLSLSLSFLLEALQIDRQFGHQNRRTSRRRFGCSRPSSSSCARSPLLVFFFFFINIQPLQKYRSSSMHRSQSALYCYYSAILF